MAESNIGFTAGRDDAAAAFVCPGLRPRRMPQMNLDPLRVNLERVFQHVLAGGWDGELWTCLCGQLWERHYRLVYSAVRGVAGNDQDTKDAVSEGWLKAYEEVASLFRERPAEWLGLEDVNANEPLGQHHVDRFSRMFVTRWRWRAWDYLGQLHPQNVQMVDLDQIDMLCQNQAPAAAGQEARAQAVQAHMQTLALYLQPWFVNLSCRAGPAQVERREAESKVLNACITYAKTQLARHCQEFVGHRIAQIAETCVPELLECLNLPNFVLSSLDFEVFLFQMENRQLYIVASRFDESLLVKYFLVMTYGTAVQLAIQPANQGCMALIGALANLVEEGLAMDQLSVENLYHLMLCEACWESYSNAARIGGRKQRSRIHQWMHRYPLDPLLVTVHLEEV